MRKQDRLPALIQTLTQGEKKYFSQQCNAQGSNKSYVKLYEALLENPDYETGQLCDLLVKDKAGLANEKKYLEKKLLQALREYHHEHPQVKTLNQIAETVLLMERNQPEMAAGRVRLAIQNASTANFIPLAWHANSLMLTLCSEPFMSYTEAQKTTTQQLLIMKELATQIQLTTDFELLNEDVFAAYSKRKTDTTEAHRAETRKLLNNELLQNDYLDFQMLSYKYSLQSLLYARMGNHKQSSQTNRRLLQLYETHAAPDIMGYWNVIANLTQSIIASGDISEYEKWMEQLGTRYYRKLTTDAAYIDNMLKQHKSMFDSGAYYRFAMAGNVQQPAIKAFARRIVKNYTAEKKLITPFHFTSLLYKTAACSLIVNDADICINLLNRLFNDFDEAVNPVVFKNARLLFLMAHAQTGSYLLAPSLLQSLETRNKKTAIISPAELQFARNLVHLAQVTSNRQKHLWFKTLRNEMADTSQNPDLQKLLETLPVKQWAEENLSRL